MNCCATDHFDQTTPEIHEEICMAAMFETDCCVRCGDQGRPVSKKTVLLMLKSDLLTQEISESFRFCSTRDCPVVYFEDDGDQQFTIYDLRIRVGLKVNEDPIPLCYCFGFDESNVREQIARTGETTIPETISRLIGADLCACDARNPFGMCCLGEVNKAAKRLKSELSESSTKLA
jgi:hypothetical protein